MNFQKVLESAILNDGISYSINSGTCNPNSGYMVSKFGCETISQSITLDIILAYVKHNLDELANDESYLGIWLKDGQWYLDVSVNIYHLDYAVKFARDNKQLAIWDCANCEEIVL